MIYFESSIASSWHPRDLSGISTYTDTLVQPRYFFILSTEKCSFTVFHKVMRSYAF